MRSFIQTLFQAPKSLTLHAIFHFLAEKVAVSSHCAFHFQRQGNSFSSWPVHPQAEQQLKTEREKIVCKGFFLSLLYYLSTIILSFFITVLSTEIQSRTCWYDTLYACKCHKNLFFWEVAHCNCMPSDDANKSTLSCKCGSKGFWACSSTWFSCHYKLSV